MSYDENRISDLTDGGIQKENELFKGTRGSDQDQRNYGFNILYPNWDCSDVVGFYEQGQEKAFVVGYKQALKDSKTEEMLEMLQKVLKINKHHNFNGHLINQQIEQLIKQVIEL